ncbi:MAG: hypothetical protein GTO18_17890 [Anaerolineales bacterium]|nr:hypothetical protein [Anaerolineales bacterium]
MRSQLPSLSSFKCVLGRFSPQLGGLLLLTLFLSACTTGQSVPTPVDVVTDVSQVEEARPFALKDWTRQDNQGAVEVSVTPLNIDTKGIETIDFEIFMNTHSVDLSMDLATLSTLETNLGEQIHPLSWSGGGGHHVQGILIFPALNNQGNFILDGITNLTLTIRDVDAAVREFVWEVNGRE